MIYCHSETQNYSKVEGQIQEKFRTSCLLKCCTLDSRRPIWHVSRCKTQPVYFIFTRWRSENSSEERVRLYDSLITWTHLKVVFTELLCVLKVKHVVIGLFSPLNDKWDTFKTPFVEAGDRCCVSGFIAQFLHLFVSSKGHLNWVSSQSLHLLLLSIQFVAQPNCQQLLATLWYDGFPGWRRRHWAVKLVTCFIIGLLFPVFSLVRKEGGRKEKKERTKQRKGGNLIKEKIGNK